MSIPIPLHSILSAALALPALAIGAQPPEEPPPIYEGRQVAHVMSYRGAPWLERVGRDTEEDTAALIRKMDLKPGQKVADIGCGSGYYSRRMAEAVGEGGTVFAVDVQPEMLAILKQKAAGAGLAERIIPVPGQAGNASLPDGEIDWTIFLHTHLMHTRCSGVFGRRIDPS